MKVKLVLEQRQRIRAVRYMVITMNCLNSMQEDPHTGMIVAIDQFQLGNSKWQFFVLFFFLNTHFCLSNSL